MGFPLLLIRDDKIRICVHKKQKNRHWDIYVLKPWICKVDIHVFELFYRHVYIVIIYIYITMITHSKHNLKYQTVQHTYTVYSEMFAVYLFHIISIVKQIHKIKYVQNSKSLYICPLPFQIKSLLFTFHPSWSWMKLYYFPPSHPSDTLISCSG